MKNLVLLLFLFVASFGFSQQIEYVDFKTANADIGFGDFNKNEVGGTVIYEFEVLKDIDSIFVDAKDFKTIECFINGNFSVNDYNGKQLIVKNRFRANNEYELKIVWRACPKKAMYFVDCEYEGGNKQIWTQGQGKYTSNWFPSIDDMNDKIEFDLNISFKNGYEVISNGKLIKKEVSEKGTKWHYDMQNPMSSYLVALVIGKYDKKAEYSKSGIPLEMYYYPEDSLKVEPTYRYTKQMFDFLEEEIGVSYPWQNYKQVPVKDFLYAGMENTSTTIFSDAFLIDSIAFVDKNYVNVNAHELAHQWFGDLVTETSGTHHWLQEGFATYYALLAERDVFGDDYYYLRLYEYAEELIEQDKAEGGTSLLDSKSSSTTFYKKGAWVLHMLREKVGDKAFKKGVKNYLKKHQFKNVETDDFISEVEKASGHDLDEFVKKWLIEVSFPYESAVKSLEQSDFIREYLEINLATVDSKCDFSLRNEISDKTKSKIISLVPGKITHELFNSSLEVRQTIAKSLSKIPLKLKMDYESLLDDKSYVTIETALFNLWNNFSENRKKYLNKTKGIQGFNDKNVRILWLVLALITEDFETENKTKYFEELTDYTSPKYGFEIRQNAFQYLNQVQACYDVCKENLEQATKHHNWQFSKFAKGMLKSME